jgi:GNAT superfamily N-acetyltransferase
LTSDRSSQAELRTLSRDAFSSALEVLNAAVADQFDFEAVCPKERARSSLVRATAEGALQVALRRGEVVGAYMGGSLKAIAVWHVPGTPKLPTFWEQLCCYPVPWRCYLSFRTPRLLRLLERAMRKACCGPPDAWHLAGLAVLRDARGVGIGARLVKAGQARAREGGHPVSAICMAESLPFYEALGFTREGDPVVVGDLVEFQGVVWLPDVDDA